jgi:acetyl-CoA acetyltransferase
MLTGPVPATRKALRRQTGAYEIDLIEVNEASPASSACSFARRGGCIIIHGGAIALHSLGVRGAADDDPLHALEIDNKRYGRKPCCGGGMGTGTIIERLG